MRTAISRTNFRGGYALIIDGSPILFGGVGTRIPGSLPNSDGSKTIDQASVFELASISKPFTVIAILQLVEKGKLSLDSTIETFFADELATYAGPKDAPAFGITVRQLLSHQTGLDNDTGISKYDETSRTAMVHKFFASTKIAEPGTRFDYNNAAYCLLAAIIEVSGGQPFEAYMREHVFTPAGMARTGFPPGKDLDQSQRVRRKGNFAFHDHPWGWGYRGCGGILTTPGDLVAFDSALNANVLISADSAALTYAPGKPIGSRQPNATYSLGWFVEIKQGMLRASHSGGSFGCKANMVRYPNQHVTIVALSDETADPFAITDAAERALLNELRALPAMLAKPALPDLLEMPAAPSAVPSAAPSADPSATPSATPSVDPTAAQPAAPKDNAAP